MNKTFKEGETVAFKLSGFPDRVFLGIIRGKAYEAIPLLGGVYIIDPMGVEFPNDAYPYSLIAVPELSIKEAVKGFPEKPSLAPNQIIEEFPIPKVVEDFCKLLGNLRDIFVNKK